MWPTPSLAITPDALTASLLLALVLFAVGLSLPAVSPSSLRASGRGLVILLLLQWLLIPALTWAALVWALPAESRTQGMSLALLLVATTPGGKGALAFCLLASADLALALAAALSAVLLASLLTPAWLTLALAETQPEARATWIAALQLLALSLPPLALGLLIRRYAPSWQRPLRWIVQSVIAVAFLISIAGAWQGLSALQPDGGWHRLMRLVVLHHAAIVLAADLLARLSRLPPPQRRAVVLSAGFHNAALALPLVLLLAPDDPLALATVALWGLWRLAAASLLSLAWARRWPARRPELDSAAPPGVDAPSIRIPAIE